MLSEKLLDEWIEKDILPGDVSAGSNKKILWRDKFGHEWGLGTFPL